MHARMRMRPWSPAVRVHLRAHAGAHSVDITSSHDTIVSELIWTLPLMTNCSHTELRDRLVMTRPRCLHARSHERAWLSEEC